MPESTYNEKVFNTDDETLRLLEKASPLSALRRTVLDVLKSVFSQAYWDAAHECPNPFLFIPDANGDNAPNTPLIITSDQAEEQTIADGRYYIVVEDGPMIPSRVGIGNLLGGRAGIQVNNQGQYSTLVDTSVSITCKSKQWKSAQILALRVWTVLMTANPVIRSRSVVHSLANPTVSKKQLEDSTGSQSQRNFYIVEQAATLVYNWEIKNTDSEIIKEIVLDNFPPNC